MKDLTKGRIPRLILGFAIPLLIGNLFQLLYNLIDVRIVGETLGGDALAAVGASSPINSLIIGFLNGLTNGFSIVIAKYFGAENTRTMKKAVGATVILGFATAAVLTAASFFVIRPFLVLLQTPDSIIDQSFEYISVILLCMTVPMIYNMLSGILRAIGDTVSSLIFLIISALINVGLDFLFILGFGMGVRGAAVATVISQLLAGIACFVYMMIKYPVMRLKKEDFKLEGGLVSELLSTGISMGFMLSFVAIGTVVLQGAINSLGEETIIAHTAARKISEMFMLPISVFGATAATFSSQNLGAGKYSRILKGMKTSIFITWIWSAVVVLVTYFFSPFLIKLVSGMTDAAIVETASFYLRFDTPFYFVLCILIVMRNAMQGVGDRVSPILSSVVELIGKVAVAFILAPLLDYFGIIISEPLIWILMSALLLIKWHGNPVRIRGKEQEKETVEAKA